MQCDGSFSVLEYQHALASQAGHQKIHTGFDAVPSSAGSESGDSLRRAFFCINLSVHSYRVMKVHTDFGAASSSAGVGAGEVVCLVFFCRWQHQYISTGQAGHLRTRTSFLVVSASRFWSSPSSSGCRSLCFDFRFLAALFPDEPIFELSYDEHQAL